MERPKPLAGAREGLQKLKAMGYSLIVITARSEMQREGTEFWLAEHLPDCECANMGKEVERRWLLSDERRELERGTTSRELVLTAVFDEIHFTGAFNHLIPVTKAEHEGHAAKRVTVGHKRRTKHEVSLLLAVTDTRS